MPRKKPMSKIPTPDPVVRTKKTRGNSDLKQASEKRKQLRPIPLALEVDGIAALNPTGEAGRELPVVEPTTEEPTSLTEAETAAIYAERENRRDDDTPIQPPTSDGLDALNANWYANATQTARETEMDRQKSESAQPTGSRSTLDEDTIRATGAQVSVPFFSGKSGRDRDIVNSLCTSGVCVDPIKLKDLLWPDIIFYREQEEVIYSVLENDETYVVAANQMGKDFVAAYIALYFFLSRTPCRILTTSVDHYQLEGVLWGEIRRFLQTSKYSLDSKDGGPLVINHMHLRKIVDGKVCGLSYMIGRVSAKGEGMLGHHVADVGDNVPRTLVVFDEGSGIDDINYEMCTTWAKRVLVIGNAWPTDNFFRKAVDDGDVLADSFKLPRP